MPPQSERTKEHRRSRERAGWRKDFARASGEAQQETTRTRGLERRSTASHVTNERIRERNASEAARIQSRASQSEIAKQTLEARRVQRVQTQEELNSLRHRDRVISGTQSTVSRSSIWSTFVMLFFLGFGMIAIYILVTNGTAFGGIASTVGNFIHGISSNTPLFVKKPTDSTTSSSPGITTNPGSSSGGGYGGGNSTGGGGGGASITSIMT